MSLERALSKLGLASRNEARSLIESGRVKVHGSLERDPERTVNPDTAHIEIDGSKAVRISERLVLFHKPSGVLTTKRDPEGRKTIYDVLPSELHALHPVGRLDQHTSGLLLLTNLTRVSSFLTDPENAIPRVYLAEVRGEVTPEVARAMEAGVEDKRERLRAAQVQIEKASGRESRIRIELRQGKYREVRRLCLHFGHEVTALKRLSFGIFELGELPAGAWVEAREELFNEIRQKSARLEKPEGVR